jgi:hypothetical protein
VFDAVNYVPGELQGLFFPVSWFLFLNNSLGVSATFLLKVKGSAKIGN